MGFDLPSQQEKRNFFANHMFHERQMNSCPIGCAGCAVSASQVEQGSMAFADLAQFYDEAHALGVSLNITKVEGYDPVFVKYSDNPDLPFSQSIVAAINKGHTITTPVCTTGSWKTFRTKWQLEELGKLSNKYREFTYPSGTRGNFFVLSVPREIKPFAGGKYNFEEHVDKLVTDIKLLSKNGDLSVLIYCNSKLSKAEAQADRQFAVNLQETVDKYLNISDREKVKLEIADFNSEITPESCMRYENSLLFSNRGFSAIDPVTLEWELDKKLLLDKPPLVAA